MRDFYRQRAQQKLNARSVGIYRMNQRRACASFVFLLSVATSDNLQVQPFHFPEVVTVGDKVSAICGVRSGSPPFSFSWLKDGLELRGVKIQNQEEESILKINSVEPTHAGNYTCTVSNGGGFGSGHVAPLVVRAPPKWKRKPTSQRALQGESVEFLCEGEGIPKPKVLWFRQKGKKMESLNSNPGKHSIAIDGTLKLNSVNRASSGAYHCHVSSGFGSNLTAYANLSVTVPAHFLEKFKVENVRRGERAALICQAVGDQPLTITWMRDKELVDFSENTRYEKFETMSEEDTMSELAIRSVERADGALYTCSARNEFGTDERNLKVLVVEVPAQPLDVRTLEVWSRSCSVTWSAPFGGNSPITNYIVQYWRHKGSDSVLGRLFTQMFSPYDVT